MLFRPEDVALAPKPEALDCPLLGQAEVEEVGFGGSFERLRLRLPPIPGVRPISPPVTFGSNSILLDVSRSPEQALRFPLQPGARTWVGVHRIHALAHPGLSILIVTDGSLRAQAALSLGGQIARLAHARVTLLGCGQRGAALEEHLQEARKQLGSGLAALDVQTSFEPVAQAVFRAVEVQPCDMVIMGFNAEEDMPLAEQVLHVGEHHLLLIPSPQQPPSNALICVASGEPGKDDVLFAGRFMRHLGAEATLLSIPGMNDKDPGLIDRTERFLEGGVQSLSILGVPARTLLRFGSVVDQIQIELKNQEYDMLVLGSPLAGERGEISLSGVVEDVLNSVHDRATMIVRSHQMGGQIYPLIIGSWEPAPRARASGAGASSRTENPGQPAHPSSPRQA